MIAAVVPAAGHSQRMGRPKLILQVGGQTVIARVVSALRAGGASLVVVVAPGARVAGAAVLVAEAVEAGAEVVTPEVQPPDMRSSFEHGLAFLEARHATVTTVLLTPADSPGLTSALVKQVVERALDEPSRIVAPTFNGRRGHPIALPRALAYEVRDLPPGIGINSLVALRAALVTELAVADPGAITDLDTPEDLERWLSGAYATTNRHKYI